MGVRAYEAVCAADDVATEAHNLGVLRFLQAVAATEEAQKGTPEDISDDLACVELLERRLQQIASGILAR